MGEKRKNTTISNNFKRIYYYKENLLYFTSKCLWKRNTNTAQKELSELTGIAQGDISKLENGNANPSIRTLTRIANALGKELVLSFVPISERY